MALIDEIREQPAVVERLVTDLPGRLAPIREQVERQGIGHVLIAARGSSDHAAVYGVYALGAMAGAWWCEAEARRSGGSMRALDLMAAIGRYNEVDCRTMAEVLSFLRRSR